MAIKKLIDLYPYRLIGGKPQFLLLKRAKGKIYEGQWRMIGGKVNPGETSWQAALRELKEETRLVPVKFWAIPSVNQFYEAASDTIHAIPAFAAQVDEEVQPVLDDEHTGTTWADADSIQKYIHWPEQRRLVQLTNSIILSDQILDDWLIPVD